MAVTHDDSIIPWDRFLSKFDVGDPEKCWEWKGNRAKNGYGKMHFQRDKKWYYGKAHRLSFLYFKGSIPEGLHVCHHCDNPLCVNPAHLYAGTHDENMSDKVTRGRQPNWPGEKNGRAKLTEAQIVEIRQRYAAGETQVALANAYGVGQTNISRIILNRNWQHVTIPE